MTDAGRQLEEARAEAEAAAAEAKLESQRKALEIDQARIDGHFGHQRPEMQLDEPELEM